MRKVLFRILPAVFLVLAANAHATNNYHGWYWNKEYPVWSRQGSTDGKYLTQNNGAHCVAMHEYNNGDHRLLVAATLAEQTSCRVRVYEYEDIWDDIFGAEVLPHNDDNCPSTTAACIDAGPNFKAVAAGEAYTPYRWWCASQELDVRESYWPYFSYIGTEASVPDIAVACEASGFGIYVAHRDDVEPERLYCSRSSDGGEHWFTNTTIESGHEPVQPSLGVGDGGVVYCAFQHDDYEMEDCDIWFKSSTDHGEHWSTNETDLTPNWYDDELPCLAASGSMVFVCWQDYDGNIVYRRSSNGGSSWSNEAMAWAKSYYPGVVVLADQVNAVLIPGGTYGSSEPYWHVLLAAKGVVVDLPQGQVQLTYTVLKRGILKASGDYWDYPVLGMSPCCLEGDFAGYCPSICGVSDSYDTLAACVWADPGQNVYVARGHWCGGTAIPGGVLGTQYLTPYTHIPAKYVMT